MVETVLVTGAYGLIGHDAVVALRNAGMGVVAVDQAEKPAAPAAFTAIRLDIADREQVERLIAKHAVTAIVHCAGVSGPMVAQHDPFRVIRENVMATATLLEIARKAQLRRFVNCSSSGAYGETSVTPVREDARLGATDMYGASKAAGDILANAYAAQYGVPAISLRPCWIYGPRRMTACLIKEMLGNALAGRPTRLAYGHGWPRQYLYVDDVVSAILAALRSPDTSCGRSYNIAGGRVVTLDQVGDIVRSLVPQAQIHLAPGADPLDVKQDILDITAAASQLGWTPQVSLEEGIRRLCEFMKLA
jgi:nucleoside-diphosphate-sugar epimerase